MRKTLKNGWKRATTFVLAAAMVVTMLPADVQAAPSADADVTTNAPAIYSDVPDIDMIRVEDAYYMVSATMHLSPGCPIMKSTDLVNWETVNYVFDTLGDTDAMNLKNGVSMYGKGQEAASLKCQDGTYYVSFNSDSTGKSYIYTTKDIEKGKWKKYVLEGVHKNLTLFFDDGKQYIIYGDGEIKCAEFTLSDVTYTVETAGTEKKLFDVVTSDNASGKTAGGTHIIKKDTFYYIFHAAVSDGKLEQVCHRTTDFANGTWEKKTIIAANDSITQSGVIDKADGTWCGFLMKEQGAVGNVPVLTGCTWTENWPVLAGTADVASASDGKALTKPDDFNNIVEEETEDGTGDQTGTGNETGTEGEDVRFNLIFQNGVDWNFNDPRYSVITGKKGVWTTFSYEYTPDSKIYGEGKKEFSTTQNWFRLEGGAYTTADGTTDYMDIYLDDVSLKEKAEGAEEIIENGNFETEAMEKWSESAGYNEKGAHHAAVWRTEDPKDPNNHVLGITGRELDSASGRCDVSTKLAVDKTYILSGKILCMERKADKIVELVSNGDFENGKGTKGWEPVDGAEISVAEDDNNHVMKVSGRTKFASSAAYDLTGDIQKGETYRISGRLKYTDGPDTRDFVITFQNGLDADYRQTKYWPSIAAKKGQWVDFSIYFIPGVDESKKKEAKFSPSRTLMFIQSSWQQSITEDRDLMDFYFDDISITGHVISAEKEAKELITNGDFEGDKGITGWTVNGSVKEGEDWVPAAEISVDSEGNNKVLKVTNRKSFEAGPRFDLTGKIQKGKKYTVKGRIKYTGGESTVPTKIFKVEFQNGATSSHRQPVEITLTKDVWKEFEFKYVPWNAITWGKEYEFSSEQNYLLFETPWQNQTTPSKESDYMDYYIDDISVTGPAIPGEEPDPGDDDNQDSKLDTHWQWNHNPDNSAWTLTERDGWLRLHAGKAASLLDARNTLTQRTFGPACSGKIKMDISHMSAGDVAGLAAFSYNYGYIAVKKEAGGAKLVMVDASGNTDAGAVNPVEKADVACTGDTVYLKEDFNLAGNEDGSGKDTVTFYYSFDNETWTKLGTPMAMTHDQKNPMGYRYAIFNYTTADTSEGYVDYDYFRISDQITGEGPSEEDEEYTVTFNANGGMLSAADATRTVTKGGSIGPLPTVTRDGYTFKGWYTAQTDGEKVTAAMTVNRDMTLYAQWEEKKPEQPGTEKWTVTFNVNGGNNLSAADATRKVIKGQAIGNLPTATRTGYTFKGWYTKAENGDAVTKDTLVNSDMTVYAQWEEKEPEQPGTQECTVTFDVNGGNELTDTTKKVTKGGTIGELPTPSKDGYTFKGWYTKAENGDAVTKDTVVNSDMTVYAQWTAKPGTQECTVTFDVNGGNELTNTTRKVMKGGKIGELPTVTRDGYTFKGWYTKAENGDAVTKDTLVNSDMTVYAQWTAQQKPEDEPKEASKTEMSGKINEAKALLNKLSDAEKGKLQAAIKKAEDILKKDGLTESELKTAINDLKAAIDAANKTVGSGSTDGPKDEKPAVGMAFETADGLKYVITAYGSAGKTVTVTGAAKQLTAVTIPDTVSYKNETFTVTAVGEQAFVGQTGLKSVVIGKNVASIGKKAFFNVSSLAKVTINGTDVKMGADAFKGISKKATFNMPKNFTSGKLKYKITKNTASVKEASVSGATGQLKSVQIPATVKYNGIVFKVTAVDKKAFRNQKKLTSVTVGKNVKSIGAEAFSGAKKLAKIKFSGTAVRKIGKNAFKNIKKNATFSIKKSKRASLKKLLKKANTKNFKVK